MKVTIPQELKSDIPQTAFGKILSATPVVMAVVATMLAGLASSEMTRAQYDRALAAQQQSKAGDQWSFFQAKRLRGAIQRNTVDLMQSTVEVRPLEVSGLKVAVEQLAKVQGPVETQDQAAGLRADLLKFLETPGSQEMLNRLRRGELPAVTEGEKLSAEIKASLDAVENLESDADVAALLAKVDNRSLDAAVLAARDRAQAFDAATKPINQAIDQLDLLLSRHATFVNPGVAASATRDFTVARLRFAALRYEVEARLNQGIANLYELQVRKSNISAERHHRRSQRFFFGMLGAQMGVIISTLAMAARKRNLLWGLAAGAGLIAILFAVYVYLYV